MKSARRRDLKKKKDNFLRGGVLSHKKTIQRQKRQDNFYKLLKRHWQDLTTCK